MGELVVEGIKHYYYSAIDVRLKFTLSLVYRQLNSQPKDDYDHRFQQVYPLRIGSWQTDNRRENLGEFAVQLR